jgi:hypothetical protein
MSILEALPSNIARNDILPFILVVLFSMQYMSPSLGGVSFLLAGFPWDLLATMLNTLLTTMFNTLLASKLIAYRRVLVVANNRWFVKARSNGLQAQATAEVSDQITQLDSLFETVAGPCVGFCFREGTRFRYCN